MALEQKLSLRSAILVNLNIMMGAGIFINTVELAKRAGFLGFLAYGIVGLLLVPLIISIAQLVQLYPDGGFFTYAHKELNPFAAFLSAWGYFVGKLGSAILMIHTAMRLLWQIVPMLQLVNIFILDLLILTLFIALNMFNLKTGRTIQAWLMGFKIIPVLFVIFTGLYLVGPGSFNLTTVSWAGITSSIPLVFFAFLGFEATCSLSSNIENAQRNGPLAIFISYGFVILLYVLYQLLFYTGVGSQLAAQGSFLSAFPLFLAHLGLSNASIQVAQVAINIAIAASALGGSYGILFSNNWNLYMLAKNNYIPFAGHFTRLNANGIAIACVLAEGAICALYLLMSHGLQEALQLTSVLGSVTAYTISVIALLAASYRRQLSISRIVIYLALFNCLLLIGTCASRIVHLTIWPMAGFFGLLLLGSTYFILRRK